VWTAAPSRPGERLGRLARWLVSCFSNRQTRAEIDFPEILQHPWRAEMHRLHFRNSQIRPVIEK
jgi:hypothetical protein